MDADFFFRSVERGIDRMLSTRPVHPLRMGFWSLILGVLFIVVPFKRVVISGNSMFPTLKNGESYLVDPSTGA